jgi:hypothetical protein
MQVESGQPKLPGFEDDDPLPPSAGVQAPAVLFESPEEICRRVFRQIRPRTPLPEIVVRYRKFANANAWVRLEAGRLELRIADVLQSAPSMILEALAHILISKLYRKQAAAEYQKRYRLYLNRQDVRRRVDVVRQARGRKDALAPQGAHFDLETLFAELNQRFFGGLMAQPRLGWTRRVSRTVLGHYDSSHHTIILSRLLDGPHVPRLAVEYVLYHEMLHLKHPVEHKGSRRRVHPKAFREEEKLFPGLDDAKKLLEQLCRGARPRPESW